ncbi:unnamed protein product [Clavelina lepadiformis]|uniref:Uncharacterized protein n=1 Tax=Clavelina lepadiformis TaxID=159417 RepID=A0ABP0GNJ1_CLALP
MARIDSPWPLLRPRTTLSAPGIARRLLFRRLGSGFYLHHMAFYSTKARIEPGTYGTECSVYAHELRSGTCKQSSLTNMTKNDASVVSFEKKIYTFGFKGPEPRTFTFEFRE